MAVILDKLKEVCYSILPVFVVVILLSMSLVTISFAQMARFVIGTIFVLVGLTLFLIGVEKSVTPLGKVTGISLAKTNRLWIVLLGGLLVGFFVSIAEPGLFVLANQVNTVTAKHISTLTILIVVSIGLAFMLSLGFMRIFYNVSLSVILLGLYSLIFVLSFFTSREFLAIAFDASGATTGILAVPFILALSAGISRLKKDVKSSEQDSFGLVSIASAGAIIGIMCLDIFSKVTHYDTNVTISANHSSQIFAPFMSDFLSNLFDSTIAMLPLVLIFILCKRKFFHLKTAQIYRMSIGFVYAFLGILCFFIGVNTGFMDIGIVIGQQLIMLENKWIVISAGFIIGFITILAEPAVHILTYQIEDVTSGYVKRKAVLLSLAFGVGLAVLLSIVRILVPEIQLWHYLLPGYALCLGLMCVTPKLFIGMAFDAGGVATGPITATFILAFIQGAAFTFEGADLMIDGFGMIAMVAMMPILTLELLGILFRIKMNLRKGV
ncbi:MULTISPECIES: DUF1538 domain-containing protein [unclassified Granulicatella]|uniref:DUF1538 domain-containing protein n=1 Tax=unclassified Granulicatella TaxID=2630493 RepID=UPI00107338DB|nr:MULTISPECIES: DUF1538 domain-containing protein [unclassified Granulicatella]MBF0780827.1 DUF1538 domain-containing protein [Granulicatella sp. 19428wC4_WM01]TFU93534.1 DUF1538 domain-containing protein [Granulicatella sp. WM01]